MHCWISRLLQVYVLSAEFKVRFLYLFTKKKVYWGTIVYADTGISVLRVKVRLSLCLCYLLAS